MRLKWISMSAGVLLGCATSVPLGELLQEGLDHPRERKHSHTGDDIRVSGVIVSFHDQSVNRGYNIEATTTTATFGRGSVGTTTGAITPNIERFVVVDIRPDPPGIPGYARCRFRAGDYDPELGIGKTFSFHGEFKGYQRTPQGLQAEFVSCIPD
jgi:hypothetical protein